MPFQSRHTHGINLLRVNPGFAIGYGACLRFDHDFFTLSYEFKRNRVNFEDEFRDDLLSTAVNNKKMNAVLDMKKLCWRWISHNLTEVQKTYRVTWFNAMLTRFKEEKAVEEYEKHVPEVTREE
ncbi:hypothetical protein EVAR_38455_1 [Eumeta japonica]|uniref:Mariner Mos1 transposase n=1 Tax=Eumeta variegata TaxID=151549 RepID=A0A4C1WPQ2_EUMVA|nr:hypothetical protein EVAR_38455_1 [Eumeta japonica]